MPLDPHLVEGLSGTITLGGDNVVLTPPGGQSVRLFYICLGRRGLNVDATVVAVRFGAKTPIYTIPLVPGAVWARNIRAGGHYQQGDANETMVLYLSSAVSVCWSVEYLFLPG